MLNYIGMWMISLWLDRQYELKPVTFGRVVFLIFRHSVYSALDYIPSTWLYMQTLTRYSVIIHFEPCSTNINTRCSHTFTPHTSVASCTKPLNLKRNTCSFSMLLSCTLKLNTLWYGNYFQACNKGYQLPTWQWRGHLIALFPRSHPAFCHLQ